MSGRLGSIVTSLPRWRPRSSFAALDLLNRGQSAAEMRHEIDPAHYVGQRVGAHALIALDDAAAQVVEVHGGVDISLAAGEVGGQGARRHVHGARLEAVRVAGGAAGGSSRLRLGLLRGAATERDERVRRRYMLRERRGADLARARARAELPLELGQRD